MRSKTATVCATVLIAANFAWPAMPGSRAAAATMRITKLSVKPRVARLKELVTFSVQVQGMHLSFKNIGKPSVAGEGHVQYYLDRIPTDAWTRRDVHHTFLGAIGTPVAIFRFNHTAVRVTPGKHQILVALAKNNYVLYHAPVAKVTIWVKR